jgi:hypothetical protein
MALFPIAVRTLREQSEKIVPAGHLVFSNEGAVLEIKRILQESLMRQKARIEVGSGW